MKAGLSVSHFDDLHFALALIPRVLAFFPLLPRGASRFNLVGIESVRQAARLPAAAPWILTSEGTRIGAPSCLIALHRR
jgi:hypothetical protein